MPIAYEFWITNDAGTRLAQITTGVECTVTRAVSDVGKFTLKIPISAIPLHLIRPDNMFQFWRASVGGQLKLWRVYFIRRWVFEMSGSDEYVTMAGPDTNELLRRRVVAAYQKSTQSKKTGLADNLMKAYLRDALSNAIPPTPTAGTRAWPNLTVQADVGLGPSVERSLPWHNLFTSASNGVIAVLAKTSREAGNEVFFDIVPKEVSNNRITFEFRTSINQPGADVTDSVTFDTLFGNMQNPKLEFDYSDEENYIYSIGQGEGIHQKVVQVYDAARYSQSLWGRCEGVADGSQEGTTAALTAAGRSAVSAGRPKISFTASALDTDATRFGLDWDVGYRVLAKYRGLEFKSLIRAVSIQINQGGETVQARLDYTSQ